MFDTMRIAWLLLLVACQSSPKVTTEGSNAPTPAEKPAPDADPNVAKCEDIRARFRATLATRTGECKTEADCGCYSPVGGPDESCGGVTDKTTTAKLGVLLGEFQKLPCHFTHNCAAWSCEPKCVAGKCQ